MPSGVAVAPAVRKALRRASAKEVKPANSSFSDWRCLTFERDLFDVGSSIPIEVVRGKFWESDSEEGCGDLGTADIFATPSRAPCAPSVPISATPAGQGLMAIGSSLISRPDERGKSDSSSTPCPSRRPASPRRSLASATAKARTEPVKPARPPWRNIWRGPLPPPRVSPRRTLADVIIPALSAAGGGSSLEKKRNLCPLLSPHLGQPKPVQAGRGTPPIRAAPSFVGPRGRGLPDSSPSAFVHGPVAFTKPCRRLFRPSFPPVAVSPSYAEVLMAGVGGGRRGFAPARARCGGAGGPSCAPAWRT
jgi:hypothetical protein